MVGMVMYCHIGQIGQKESWYLLRHKQQGFEPRTSMDQDDINAPLMDIELAIIGQQVAALANWATVCGVNKILKLGLEI